MQKNKRYSIRIDNDVDEFISKKMNSSLGKAEKLLFLIRLGIEFAEVMGELKKIIKDKK